MYSLVAKVRPATRVGVVRPATRMYRASVVVPSKANPTTTWEEREKSAEDMDVKDHEKKLIEELAKKLGVCTTP